MRPGCQPIPQVFDLGSPCQAPSGFTDETQDERQTPECPVGLQVFSLALASEAVHLPQRWAAFPLPGVQVTLTPRRLDTGEAFACAARYHGRGFAPLFRVAPKLGRLHLNSARPSSFCATLARYLRAARTIQPSFVFFGSYRVGCRG